MTSDPKGCSLRGFMEGKSMVDQPYQRLAQHIV